MDIDDIKNDRNTNTILFKDIFKLYDKLIIEEYLTDIQFAVI